MPCIRITPLGVASADTVGSIDINKAFEDHLQKIFSTVLDREENDKQMQFDKRRALASFETYKRDFTGNENNNMRRAIPLPSLGNQTLSDMGLVHGVLQIDK